MERQRRRTKLASLKQQRRIEALERLTEEEKKRYDDDVSAAAIATHSGHWQYHDDDCLCGRYFDDSHCNRGGYTWSCCGSTSESAGCFKSTTAICVPIPGYVEVEYDENSDEL
jgi:hypothetical protein